MFAGDFTKSSGNKALDNDMVAYLDQTVKADEDTMIEQAERDQEADDLRITADLQLQPAFGQSQMTQTPQVPQGQATAQDVQALFPFDTTAQAIAQRRQNRG